jgi:hypothetical protein
VCFGVAPGGGGGGGGVGGASCLLSPGGSPSRPCFARNDECILFVCVCECECVCE